MAAVTHLEHDHPECFPTFADMQDAFERFVALGPDGGYSDRLLGEPLAVVAVGRRQDDVAESIARSDRL